MIRVDSGSTYAIAALDEDRAIGLEGAIPWQIAEDWKRFRNLTMGHALVMGRITYEGLPTPLAGRTIVVVSRGGEAPTRNGDRVARSVPEAIRVARSLGLGDVWVCGGSEIYHEALPFCDALHLTLVHARFGGDTFFPNYDEFRFEESRVAGRDPEIDFDYVILTRTDTTRY